MWPTGVPSGPGIRTSTATCAIYVRFRFLHPRVGLPRGLSVRPSRHYYFLQIVVYKNFGIAVILDVGHHMIFKTELSVPETELPFSPDERFCWVAPIKVMLRAIAAFLRQKRAWSTTWSCVVEGCTNTGRHILYCCAQYVWVLGMEPASGRSFDL
jgi:hypothetical protein